MQPLEICLLILKFKMENRQPKSEKMPSFKSETQQPWSPQREVEGNDPDWVSSTVQNLIFQGKSPFVITKDEKIKRQQSTLSPESDPECVNIQEKILTYNRKDKSLMELTRKFIQRFEGAFNRQLILDRASAEMNVERRRIYDIINIMESLGVVQKKKKNVYLWKGLTEAIYVINQIDSGSYNESNDKEKREKSLESLATEYLKLFIQNKNNFTLEQSALIILSEVNEQMRKTKVRRLYDIINVFKCLGLVQKVKNSKIGSKPAYEWLGTRHLSKIILEKQKLRQNLELMSHAEMNDWNSEQNTKKDSENYETLPSNNLRKKFSQNSTLDRGLFAPFADISNTNYVEKTIVANEIVMKPSKLTPAKKIDKEAVFRQSFSVFHPNKKERKQIQIENCSNIAQPKLSSNLTLRLQADELPSFFHILPKLLNVNTCLDGSVENFHEKLRKCLWPS